jgi:hypothetical protein
MMLYVMTALHRVQQLSAACVPSVRSSTLRCHFKFDASQDHSSD